MKRLLTIILAIALLAALSYRDLRGLASVDVDELRAEAVERGAW